MVAQIVTIVNQSGKVIKSSKTLVNVFADAKNAYQEKKAELKARRQLTRDEERDRLSEARARKQFEELSIDDNGSHRSARSSLDGSRIKRKPVPVRHDRPLVRRHMTDSSYASESGKPRSRRVSVRAVSVRSKDAYNDDPRAAELVRRHTDMDGVVARTRPRRGTRSASMDDIDMDLAYGELPPPLPLVRRQDNVELREKMTALQTLLDECNCIQHSVTDTIDRLSKNPDTMAAVALTLGEISTIAAKLAPGALTAMKGSFPAIIAMLASPQFAIAAGVGVGITVIAFGSYKIIKKIQARREDERMLLAYGDDDGSVADSVDELREIDRIEHWRRGIADAEASSAGTSVDGEFITPMATKTLIEEGKLTEADLKSKTSSHKSKKKRGKSDDSKAGKSKAKSSSGRSSKTKKEKEPSGLRMLFKKSSS